MAKALQEKKGKKSKVKIKISPLSKNSLKTVDRRRIMKEFRRIIKYMDKKYGFKIFHFVLMDNHYHAICMTTNSKYKLDRCMQTFNMMIAKMLNKLTGRTGHVFSSRYHSNLILDERYGRMVLGYIYANPMVAGIVTKPEDHDFTSYTSYILTNNHHVPVDLNCPILEGEISSYGGEIKEIEREEKIEISEEIDEKKEAKNDGSKTKDKDTKKKDDKKQKSRRKYIEKIAKLKAKALKEIVEGYLHERYGISKSEFRRKLKYQALVTKEGFEKLNDNLKLLIMRVQKGFL